MSYFCQVCKGKDFYILEGQTYCSECHTLSRAHGLETVIDQDTLGVYATPGGAALRTKKTKRSKGRNRFRKGRRRDRYITPYTTSEALTFLLKGWTDDLIELGAPESLRKTVTLLWIKYLARIGISMEAGKNESTTSNAPTFRDLQVTILGRRKVFMKSEIKLRIKKSIKAPQEDFSQETDLTRLKTMRRKRRRSFLRALSSDGAPSEASMSSVNTSLLDGSSEFSLSIRSDGNSSDVSNVSLNDSSASESGLEKDELSKERQEIDKAVLRGIKFTRRKDRTTRQYKEVQTLVVCSGRALEVLILALLLTEGHSITLSDVIYWADTNEIAFKTASEHLPPVMRLHTIEDINVILPKSWTPIKHSKMRRQIKTIGNYLELESIVFDEKPFKKVFQRFLNDLSLPVELLEITWTILEHTKFLSGNEISFANSKSVCFDTSIFNDIKACAAILFILKYLYGLDGESEVYHGANANLFNKMHKMDSHFDIMEWIRMSRVRAFLCARHSSDLHNRLSQLFPSVILCPTSQAEGFKRFAKVIENHRQKVVPDDKESVTVRRHFQRKDPERFAKVRDFCQILKEISTSKQPVVQHPNLTKSRMPLTDFAEFFTTSQSTCCNLDDDETTCLQMLLKMTQSKIKVEWDSVEVEDVTLEGNWFVQLEDYLVYKKDMDYRKCFSHERRSINICPDKKYQFKPMYWCLKFFTKEPDVMSFFPESFGWILEYLASYIDVRPNDIFNALVVLEKELEKLTRNRSSIVGDFHRSRTAGKFLTYIYPKAWSCLT